MDALRVSASDIDALRYYLADEDGDLAELLARLRREAPPTASMKAGTALHSALENIRPGHYGSLEADGYVFDLRCDGELDLPDIRETKATKELPVGGCLVTLVGKVDALHGRRIDDHKFTSRYDAEKFLGSYQWRIYLDVFEADEFRWNVFEGRPDGEGSRRYVIYAMHKLTMHRYPGMADDVAKAVGGFVDFARKHLPERFEAA